MDAKRDRLGRIVRGLWIQWAKSQPNPKPSWLVPYDELSEADKEADRIIGQGLMSEFFMATTGERLAHKRLLQIAERLRDELHSFRMLYDEHDPTSGAAVKAYDEFVNPCGVNAYLEKLA